VAVPSIRTTMHTSFLKPRKFLPQRTQRTQRECLPSLRSLRSLRLNSFGCGTSRAGCICGSPRPFNAQLTDGGPSVTAELLRGAAGPPFGGSPGSAGSQFLGSLAVNSKRLSRANHGHGAGTKKPATIIAHTPVAITMQRWVIFIAPTSCLTLLLQNTIRYPVTEVHHNHALNSGTCRTPVLSQGGPGACDCRQRGNPALAWSMLVRPLHYLCLMFRFLVGSFAESKSPILP
jgi:hypothetical protein